MKSLLDKSIHKYAGFVAFIFSMLIILLLLSIYTSAYAEKSLGIGISQSVDGEVSVGVQGEYEIPSIDIEYEYQGIEFHDAKVDVSYRHNFENFAITIFQENDWAGYSLTDLNRTNDLGVSGIIPIGEVDLEFAVFGRNGNPAGPVVRYDEKTGEEVSATPGLTPEEGTHANIAFATTLDVKGVEIEAKGLTNFAENPTLQWLLDASTSYKVGVFDWKLSAAYQGQRRNDINQHQVSTLLTVGLTW